MEKEEPHSEGEDIDRDAELANADDLVCPLLGEARWM